MSDASGETPAAPPEAPPGQPGAPASGPAPAGRWGWPLLIGALALVGVLLALADVAFGAFVPDPLSGLVLGRPSITTPGPRVTPINIRFDRNRLNQRFVLQSPFGLRGPISPFEALRIFLSNGAGLVLLAFAALGLFPTRARRAVEHLEHGHGAEIALAAGIATILLALAAVALLRFTLLFLAVIPAVLVVMLGAALFGTACISLALGRFLNRRLRLPRAHVLIAALAGALVVFDAALIPYAGVFVLAVVAITGLGLAAVTRLGSARGWAFGDLEW